MEAQRWFVLYQNFSFIAKHEEEGVYGSFFNQILANAVFSSRQVVSITT